MKKAAVIANPFAGTGRGRTSLEKAVALIEERQFTAIPMPTEGPGHATHLASQAAQDCDLVIAVGGDGTVHEVAEGLAGTICPMGVLPSGSGNDFAAGVGCVDVPSALDVISKGLVLNCDTGLLDGRFFVNSLGLLASGLVSLRAAGLWRWLGRKRYLVASLKTLLFYRGQDVVWSWGDGPGEGEFGRYLLAEICNGPLTGGGFRFAPDARFNSGQLDACLIKPVGLATGLKLLGPASRGEKLEHPAISLVRGERITFSVDEPIGYHLDGEPGMLAAGEHTIETIPGNLKVLAS